MEKRSLKNIKYKRENAERYTIFAFWLINSNVNTQVYKLGIKLNKNFPK